MENKKPTIVLPSWVDLVAAVVAALIAWRLMEAAPKSNVATVLLASLCLEAIVVLLAFFAVYLIVRTLLEPSRLYVEALDILNREIRPQLKLLQTQCDKMGQIPGAEAVQDQDLLKNALDDTQNRVINPLLEQGNGIALYKGVTELKTRVNWLEEMMPGDIAVLENPRLVPNAQETLSQNRNALTGYRDYIADLEGRVMRKDLVRMAIGARLLASLMTLIPSTAKQGEGSRQ